MERGRCETANTGILHSCNFRDKRRCIVKVEDLRTPTCAQMGTRACVFPLFGNHLYELDALRGGQGPCSFQSRRQYSLLCVLAECHTNSSSGLLEARSETGRGPLAAWCADPA